MKRLLGLTLSVLLLTSFLPAAGLSVWAEETVAESVQAPRSAAHAYTKQTWAQQLGLSTARLTTLIDTLQGDIRSFRGQTDVSSYGLINTEETKTVLSSIVFDEDPTLFMVRSFNFRYNRISKQITAILFEDNYLMSPAEHASLLQQCREAAADMVRDLNGSSLKLDQMALILHDRLALWCEYDQENYLTDTVPTASHEMYGALLKRVAVCDGYAKAYKYLLAQVGIDSTVIRSPELNHAWNILNLGGRYFHVDVTWDDPVWDILGQVKHQNFLLSTGAMRETDHTGSDFDTVPADAYYDDFFWRQQDGGSAFQYLNGDIYYIDEGKRLIRWNLAKNALSVAAEVGGDWGKYAGHPKLLSDGGFLYYNTGNEIYRFDPSLGSSERIFTLSASQFPGKYIVGMQIAGDYLLLNLWEKERFANAAQQRESLHKFRYKNNDILQIGVRTGPDKTAYCLGSTPTTDGLTVEGYYSDGELVQLSPGSYTVSSFSTDTLGEKTVTVTYKDKTVTFSVYVTDRLGDVDGKGDLTSTDARLALQSAVGKLPEKGLEIPLGDVDGDGDISSTDARLILQYAVGKIDRFPIDAVD